MGLVFLGPPGAGKGTQAMRAAQRFDLAHLSTGAMLREAIEQQTPLGKKVEAIHDRGELVDDETMMALISDRLTSVDGFILDGFPRTLAQGEGLRALLAKESKPLSGVILFEIDEGAILDRIKQRARNEGRSDDQPATFQHRLEVYHAQTSPLLAFYRAEGLLRPIDGMAPIEAVGEAIAGILDRLKGS